MTRSDMVWAMRSLRLILGDAAFRRRSAALRAEPSAKSQAKPAAAIAIGATRPDGCEATSSGGVSCQTGGAGASFAPTLAIAIFWTLVLGAAVMV